MRLCFERERERKWRKQKTLPGANAPEIGRRGRVAADQNRLTPTRNRLGARRRVKQNKKKTPKKKKKQSRDKIDSLSDVSFFERKTIHSSKKIGVEYYHSNHIEPTPIHYKPF